MQKITHSMDLRPFEKLKIYQEIPPPPSSKNRKIYNRARNSLSIIPTLSQMNPHQCLTCLSFNISFTTFLPPMF
jgi:hypothetical protein